MQLTRDGQFPVLEEEPSQGFGYLGVIIHVRKARPEQLDGLAKGFVARLRVEDCRFEVEIEFADAANVGLRGDNEPVLPTIGCRARRPSTVDSNRCREIASINGRDYLEARSAVAEGIGQFGKPC
jgi:hypothetical protein